MNITLSLAPARQGTRPRLIARVAQPVLAVIGLACIAVVVAFVRTFAFEHFHGDHAAMQDLARIILGS